MCFYDPSTGRLIGQRHCEDVVFACDAIGGCVETVGTPMCRTFTATPSPACGEDAGTDL
jgi:hypothetical protein